MTTATGGGWVAIDAETGRPVGVPSERLVAKWQEVVEANRKMWPADVNRLAAYLRLAGGQHVSLRPRREVDLPEDNGSSPWRTHSEPVTVRLVRT